jgi:hypothetical protein
MATQLRVYFEPEIHHNSASTEPVRVRLGDLLPLLTMAQRFKYAWLKDFLNDEVTISEDLYQVLQEFLGFQPTA